VSKSKSSNRTSRPSGQAPSPLLPPEAFSNSSASEMEGRVRTLEELARKASFIAWALGFLGLGFGTVSAYLASRYLDAEAEIRRLEASVDKLGEQANELSKVIDPVAFRDMARSSMIEVAPGVIGGKINEVRKELEAVRASVPTGVEVMPTKPLPMGNENELKRCLDNELVFAVQVGSSRNSALQCAAIVLKK
jgi:hypothetical protein